MQLLWTIRTTSAMLAIVCMASAVFPVSISAQQAVGEAFDEGSVERAAKTKVDAAASRPRELTEAESKERAELLATFSYMLPADSAEKKSFTERAAKLSNTALGTLFRGTKDLIDFGLIDATEKEALFRSENLLHSANLVGRAANVYESRRASAEKTRDFIAAQMSKLKLVSFTYSTTEPGKTSLSDQELAQRRQIYEDFGYIIPNDIRRQFTERADRSLSNRGLRNFLYGIILLEATEHSPKVGRPGEVISDMQIRSLLLHSDLNDAASIVLTVAKASKLGYEGKNQTNTELKWNLDRLMNESSIVPRK